MRVLIFTIGSLGDTLVSIPALRYIRGIYSSALIYLFYDRQNDDRCTAKDVLLNQSLVDDFIDFPFSQSIRNRIINWCRLYLWYVRKRFDVVIYLAPSERSYWQVKRDLFFFSFCGIRKKIGFFYFPAEFLYPRELRNKPGRVTHEAICRLMRLGISEAESVSFFAPPLFTISQYDLTDIKNWLLRSGHRPHLPMIAICPGTLQPAKSWPMDRFIQLGNIIRHTMNISLLVIGGEKEREIGDRLIKEWGTGINTAGLFDVGKSAALFACCQLAVGVDSGAMHLASAVGTPTIVLFSCHDHYGRWTPLSNYFIPLRHRVPCEGCKKTVCDMPGHPCMTGITVAEVAEKVLHYIEMKKRETDAK